MSKYTDAIEAKEILLGLMGAKASETDNVIFEALRIADTLTKKPSENMLEEIENAINDEILHDCFATEGQCKAAYKSVSKQLLKENNNV